MGGEFFLYARHAPLLPAPLDDEIIRGAHENEEHGETDGRDDHRFLETRAVADRGDIAKPRRRDRDHRKIEQVEQADMPVSVVDQPFPVDPVDEHDKADQNEGRPKAQA